MIICLCHSIKDKDIINHCQKHFNSLDSELATDLTTDIARQLHAGNDCGSCIPVIKELILSYQNPEVKNNGSEKKIF